MAIDTAEKRRSVSGIPTGRLPGVTPNASKDQEWRQQAGWSYSGILAAAPPGPGGFQAAWAARSTITLQGGVAA